MGVSTGALTLSAPSRAMGAKLFHQTWMPSTPPHAILILAHGYAEHLGRYDYFARRCNNVGLAVFALDHWGHGNSDGEPGYVPSFSIFLDGMAALLSHARATCPGLPRVLIGHSMGGLIGASHLLTHQDGYAAAVLSGPAVQPGTPPSAATRVIGRLLSKLAPHAGLIQLDATAISRDPDVVARYLEDPLVHKGKMSARMAAEMLDAMEHLQANAGQIRIPLLIAHGSEDKLAAAEGGRRLSDLVSSTDKEFRLLKGMYHEIFNEPERDDVIDGVLSWIDQRIS
ncbi:MAG: hypothetical protein RJB22_1556 [Pseudomonadota bacterium]|jgi:alpha-beta hydrolase superfamily lysophospholipase